jgi:hypothetical protein
MAARLPDCARSPGGERPAATSEVIATLDLEGYSNYTLTSQRLKIATDMVN